MRHVIAICMMLLLALPVTGWAGPFMPQACSAADRAGCCQEVKNETCPCCEAGLCQCAVPVQFPAPVPIPSVPPQSWGDGHFIPAEAVLEVREGPTDLRPLPCRPSEAGDAPCGDLVPLFIRFCSFLW